MLTTTALVLLIAASQDDPPRTRVEHRPTPAQRYLDWSQPTFPASVYAERRRRLAEGLAASGGGVFLAPSAPGRSHGQTFRQLDDFLYLTGLEVADSVFALAAQGEAWIYCPTGDARFESRTRPNDFPGMPLHGDEELLARAGVALRPLRDLEVDLERWAEEKGTLRLHVTGASDLRLPQERWVQEVPADEWFLRRIRREHPGLTLTSAWEPIARLRMVKGAEELAVLERAAAITAEAIRATARAIEPGVDERTLEGYFEAACKRGGAQRLAFDSIIKSGPNSLWPWRILASRYDRRNRVLQAGELVILDVGCELDHHVSDVGRTFPVSGSFTPEQRATLEMVTGVSDAIIAAVRPGVTFAELAQVAYASIPDLDRPYMQTGLFFGHHLGLSTGDPAIAERRLEPGMLFTVEPWYYDHDRGIAVFLEEEVVVTDAGCRRLTAGLPRTPDELEALLKD